MNAKTILSSIGKYAGGAVLGLAVLTLPWILIGGIAGIAPLLIPWLMLACLIIFAVCALVLPILALFPATRGIAAIGLHISSYVFGLTAWLMGLTLTWDLWGWIAVVIGLVILGVGVVPVAMLATLLNAMWLELAVLVLAVVLTFGMRAAAFALIQHAEDTDP